MKLVNVIKNVNVSLKQVWAIASMSFFSVMAFADTTPPTDDNIKNLAAFHTIINNNAGTIFKITVVIATLAGLILIVKGLVHLKQNYTGTGQEKHLSKGIASLAFGTGLILIVPIAHALIGSVSSGTTVNTGAGNVEFGSLTDTSDGN